MYLYTCIFLAHVVLIKPPDVSRTFIGRSVDERHTSVEHVALNCGAIVGQEALELDGVRVGALENHRARIYTRARDCSSGHKKHQAKSWQMQIAFKTGWMEKLCPTRIAHSRQLRHETAHSCTKTLDSALYTTDNKSNTSCPRAEGASGNIGGFWRSQTLTPKITKNLANQIAFSINFPSLNFVN